MGCHSIAFRRLPHQPKLFLRLVEDFPSVSRFYAHPPTFEAVKNLAANLDFAAERRKEVAAILRDQNAKLGAGALGAGCAGAGACAQANVGAASIIIIANARAEGRAIQALMTNPLRSSPSSKPQLRSSQERRPFQIVKAVPDAKCVWTPVARQTRLE